MSAEYSIGWDQQAISDALSSEAVERVHHAYGPGVIHRLPGETGDLEVYPRTGQGIIRYTTDAETVSLYNSEIPDCRNREGEVPGACTFGHSEGCVHATLIIYDTGDFL